MPTSSRSARSRRRVDADVAVQLACRARALPSKTALRRWARAALPATARIALRIVGRAEARRLNRLYRGRDHATNVLSFSYARAPLQGDIVLCHPVLAREARAQAKTLAAHYAHLVVHGALHLRGYDHRRVAARAVMERHEKRILRRLGYRDPYAQPPARPR